MHEQYVYAFIKIKLKGERIIMLTLLEYIYLAAFTVTLIIIAIKEKKTKNIDTSLMLFGSVVGGVYIIYLYIIKRVELFSIYKYVIYFAIICGLFAITKKNKQFKYKYLLEIMMICIYINIFVVSEIFLITALITMATLTISMLIKKRKSKIGKSNILAENNNNIQVPIGTYLCISNIIAMIICEIEFIKI